ncbi:conjugal transfer protein MobA [Chryseobacterium tructae]|uniref:Conjugal transfer protein MobA n=1 Tax=Chryseobacterium tructae TaxID=1037380 RepID=A0ABV7XY94_9FLAO|nr:conjugal transfer protein MobA [Chryseobacterium tructae]MDN3692544.1 conjugal transfer protein MobA [Chryseobacterium tructae]
MNENKNNKGGRKPKLNPSKNRYVFRLTDEENSGFLKLFESSGMSNKAKFITTILLQRELKIVKVDVSTMDYHTQLTKFFYQFQSIGNNYNQIVKILYRNFTEKKASFYLFKLENHTKDLAVICKQVIELTKEFDQNHIQKTTDK